MNIQNNKNILKVLMLMLAGILIISVFFTLNFYQENKKNLAIIAQEKERLRTELDALRKQYAQVIQENKELKHQVQKDADRIKGLLDSLDVQQIDLQQLSKVELLAIKYKQKTNGLQRQVDRLEALKRNLEGDVKLAKAAQMREQRKSDSLVRENQLLNSQLDNASQLEFGQNKVHAKASVRPGSKSIRKAKKTRVLEIWTQIQANTLARAGEYEMYIQIINPKNNLLGSKGSLRMGSQKLVYSLKHKFSYEQKQLDICMHFEQENFIAGRYVINLFFGDRKVVTQELNLE